MHLNEELLHVEPMWIDGKKERFQPIITDFTRKTQWIVRYKLDDILLINPKPCPCGRKTKTLKSIIGRADEVLWLPSLSGERLAPIFPDVLRKALYSVSRAPTDYLIEQYGLRWVIRLQGGDAECVIKSLVNMMEELKIIHPEFQIEFNLKRTNDIKKRRIRCHQKPS
jgi:phenylacetate-coenzyme A ligase PaaK-like adenylate-forming protein